MYNLFYKYTCRRYLNCLVIYNFIVTEKCKCFKRLAMLSCLVVFNTIVIHSHLHIHVRTATDQFVFHLIWLRVCLCVMFSYFRATKHMQNEARINNICILSINFVEFAFIMCSFK